ncbi:MAG: HAMP domain-containing histidine kinase [Gammaproteobacteria bacterium]|nr:HAMP domain-containing histidine kinase [Gammaproteobacteria bacterium]
MNINSSHLYKKKKGNKKPFRLVRWFSISGFVAIGLLSIVSASYISDVLEDHVLEQDADLMMEFVNSIVRQDTGTNSEVTVIGGGDANKLAVFFAQLNKVPGVIRANVYSPSHKIIWSSRAALIDQQFSDNHELDIALSGKPASHISYDNHESPQLTKKEHTLLPESDNPFVEYYLPIWDSEEINQHVIAVAEVYRVPKFLLNKLDHIRLSVWTMTFFGGVFLFLSLFWIIQRASRLIKQQELELLHTNRLVTIGEMASSVAHGFRNPLANIRSSAELAQENSNSEETNQSLEHIIVESDKLETWVKHYLSDTQLNENEMTSCRANSVINKCVAEFQERLSLKHIDIVTQLDKADPEINFNSTLFWQIINSLLANASESMVQSGKILLTSEYDFEKKVLEVRVVDQGVGISKDDLERIFEPFFTLKRRGLGLGLPLVKQVLERHNAKINISSEINSGTTVCLVLPLEI